MVDDDTETNPHVYGVYDAYIRRIPIPLARGCQNCQLDNREYHNAATIKRDGN